MADESWRRPHESDEEWRLRWEFITAHYGRFPDIRLKCLSSCLVNVECYGCRYPEPVMKLLKELTVGLDEVARRRQQIRATVSAKRINFVPASSNENTDDATKRWPPSSAADGADKFIAFVPANSTSNESCRSNAINDHCAKQLTCSVVTASQTGEDETLTRPTSTEEIPNARSQECIFYQLGNIVKEVAGKMSSCRSDTEILQMALDKCKFNADAQFSQLQSKSVSFLCTLTINDIFVATGEASTKKGAKHAAFSKASEILQKPYLCVDDKLHLLGGTEPFKCKSSTVVEPKFDLGFKKFGLSTIPNVRRPVAQQMPAAGNTGRIIPPLLLRPPQKRCYNDWSQFVILRSATSTVDEDASAVSVLQQSTSFNKVELIFDYASVNNQYRCCVTIDGRDVARAISDTQPSAQLSAAQQALKILSQTCCTVIIKSPGDVAMDESVKRTEVLDGGANVDKIPESNVGNLLLKKMGWTGGGIGKDGSRGIEEPVSVTAVINRAGLGSGVSGDFAKAVSRIVVDYLHSDRQDDLVFSPEFSNPERAAIHAEARKHAQQLKTRSYGSKESRYLVLSRRRTPAELVQHIRNNGGETLKYIIREPTGY